MTLFRTACAIATLALSCQAFAENSQAETPSTPEGTLPLEDLRTFTKVFEHIRRGYVEEVTDKQLLEYAIKGMVSELDPHSAYLDAKSFEDLQVNTSGEFGGLGIEVGMENGFVKVVSPIDDTPAARAGVEAGDLIIKLDDKPVKGMSLSEAVKEMRGPKGSQLTITVVRDGVDQPFELTLTRATIKVKSVRARFIEDDFAYIRIAQFQVKTGDDLINAIEKLQKNDEDRTIKGVILDLRNNPGGVLQASVKVADAFLEDGLIVYTEGRIENADLKYSATPGDLLDGVPMVVLVNDGSASASEIVAGALQDHQRAIIMGTKSFGKGSVQTVVPISEDQAIKMTTALYYTPSGRSIQAQGIDPDVIVERARVTEIDRNVRVTEADLDGHLGNANGGKESKSKDRVKNKSEKSLIERDNQVYEALTLLKGLNIYSAYQHKPELPDGEVDLSQPDIQ